MPNEVNFAKELSIPRVHVKIEPMPLPVFVSLEIATDMVADYLGELQAERIDTACPGLFRP